MTRARILLVEDDDAILDALAMALEDDYDVLCARNGVEALALLEREAIDAIVLDLMMPLLDGEGFFRAYRARGGAAPVVLASAALEVAGRAQALGIPDFLAKPFELDELQATLSRVVGGRTGGTSPPLARGGAAGSPDGDPHQESRPARRARRPVTVAAAARP